MNSENQNSLRQSEECVYRFFCYAKITLMLLGNGFLYSFGKSVDIKSRTAGSSHTANEIKRKR